MKTHALIVDLPAPYPDATGPLSPPQNLVVLTETGKVLWNGQQVSRADLRANLRAAKSAIPQPALMFEPEGNAAYGDALELLAIIADEGLVDYCFRFGNAPLWRDTEKIEPADLPYYQRRDCVSPYGY